MSEKVLRPYQKDIVDRTIKAKGSVLIQAPTGSGKTFITQKVISHFRDKKYKSLFLAPKLNLLQQTANAFKSFNPQIIHASNKKELDKNRYAFISTIQTMSRRIELLDEMDFDFIVLDEMHYGAKGKMQQIIKNIHDGEIIGLSATPYDSDGKLLNDDFDVVIDDYDTKYMVENDYLVNIRAYEAFTPNLNGIKTKRNEWDINELDDRFNTPEMIDKVVSSTKDIVSKRKKTIVFCINISHAEAICSAYKSVGLKAEVTHSKLKKDTQKEIIDLFKNKDLQVLVSVDQLTTGFDVPSTDTIVLARPTQSQNLYKQIVGRALRISKETQKEEAILLDCGGVISRLGMPLDPITQRKEIIEFEKRPYSCKKCGSVKPRVFKSNCEHSKPITICVDCKDEVEFKPKFLYNCKECKRYYDFKIDKSYFSFDNEEMILTCSCGSKSFLGSLNNDEIGFKELSNEEQKSLILKNLDEKNISGDLLDELSKNEDKDIRRKVSKHLNTTKKTLVAMAKEDFEIFEPEDFLNHPIISNDDLYHIIDFKKGFEDSIKIARYGTFNKYSRFLLKIITHPKSTQEIIELIPQYENIQFLRILAEKLNKNVIRSLPKRHYMEKRRYETTSLNNNFVKNIETILDILSFHEDIELRQEVASNESTSYKTLKKLSIDNELDIRKAVASNPSTPQNILEEFAVKNDENIYIRTSAIANLDSSSNVLKKLVLDKEYVIRNRLSQQKLDRELLILLAQNSKEDDIKINILKLNNSKQILIACVESIPMKKEILHEPEDRHRFDTYEKFREKFLLMVLDNKYTREEILKEIIETKHEKIYEALKDIYQNSRSYRISCKKLDLFFSQE